MLSVKAGLLFTAAVIPPAPPLAGPAGMADTQAHTTAHHAAVNLTSTAVSVGIHYAAKKLVRELGNPEYRVREAAQKNLLGMGRYAESALRKGVASGDAEIGRRAATLLRGIDADKLWDHKTLAIDVKGAPVTELVTLLGKESGTPIVLAPSLDKSLLRNHGVVTVRSRGSLWEVLNEVERETGLAWRISPPSDYRTIELVPRGHARIHVAAAINRDVVFTVSAVPAVDELTASLRVPINIVAPGYRLFNPRGIEIGSVIAVTDEGERLSFRQSSLRSFGTPDVLSGMDATYSSFITGQLEFDVPRRQCWKIARLEISYELACYANMKKVAFTDYNQSTEVQAGNTKIGFDPQDCVKIQHYFTIYQRRFFVGQGLDRLMYPTIVTETKNGRPYRAVPAVIPESPYASKGHLTYYCNIPASMMRSTSVCYFESSSGRQTSVALNDVPILWSTPRNR